MISFLQKISNGKAILFVLITTAAFTFGFSYMDTQLQATSDTQVNILDMELMGYNFDKVTTELDNMNENGRAIYRKTLLLLDFAYPFAYGGLMLLVLAFLLKKVLVEKPRLILFSLFPIVIIVFDVLENINTLNILKTFPYHTNDMVSYGSRMTQCKWMAILFTLIPIIILGAKWGRDKIKGNRVQ